MDLGWRGCEGGLDPQLRRYLDSWVLSDGAWVLGLWSTAEEPGPWVCMQPRRATDRLAPLAISIAACW